jgi:membrane protease YdiL (CAAX protease family)
VSDGRSERSVGSRGRPLAFYSLVLGVQVVLGAAGQLLLSATGRGSLLDALRPELPWTVILALGGAVGLTGALLVAGLYRFVPGYARAVRPVVELLRRLPRGRLWVAALLSPLGEEFFFRGALQPVVGLLWAALAFGLLHTGFRREHLAYGLTAAGLGLLFGLGSQFLGELWAAVTAHGVYNAVVLAALPLSPPPSTAGVEPCGRAC